MKKITLFALLAVLIQFMSLNIYSQWIEWEKYPVYDMFSTRTYSLLLTADGSIVVGGKKYGGYIYKSNQSGDSVWYCSNASGYSLTEDNSGNIYSVYDSTLYKINNSGNLIWQKNLSDLIYRRIRINKIIKSDDNCIIAAGYTLFNDLNSGFIAKFDLNGTRLWANTVHLLNKSYSIWNISQISDGSFLVIGNSSQSGINLNFISKFNLTGQLIFERSFGDNTDVLKNGFSAFRLSDQSYLTFNSMSSGSIDSKLVISSLDSSGNFLWRKIHESTYGGYFIYGGESIIRDRYKNQYIVAGSKPILNGFNDTNYCTLTSYDSLGNLLWEKFTFSDSMPAFYSGVRQNIDSSYVICGDAFKNFASSILSEPKYTYLAKTKKINPIGITITNSEIPDKYTLHQNYPNPFNPITKIKFELPKSSDLEFNVYDILGRKVYSAYYNKTAGTYEIDFDGSGFASGIYFYSVKAGEYYASKKLIILK